MTTKVEIIEENQPNQTKWSLATANSLSSMTHVANQDAKTSLNKSPISDESHEVCILSSDSCGTTLHSTNPTQLLPENEADIFENEFEASIEQAEVETNGYETDTESSLSDDNLENSRIDSDDCSITAELKAELLRTLPTFFKDHNPSDSSGSDNDEEAFEAYTSTINKTSQCRSLDIFRSRPHLMPFIERRRLSQCKEEDEDDGDKSSQYQSPESKHSILNTERQTMASPKLASPLPPPVPAPLSTSDKASAEKFKDLERLRQQFMHKIDSINTRNVEDIKTVCAAEDHNSPPPPPPIPPSILPPALINLLESAKAPLTKLPLLNAPGQDTSTSQHNEISMEPVSIKMQPLVIKGKFTVTKALEVPVIKQIKPEAKQLLHTPIACNAHTISFPCKYDTNYTLARTIFPQNQRSDKKSLIQPHLSKEFFDSSLVEIRNLNKSLHSLNINSDGKIFHKNRDTFPYVLDEVWIKQANSQGPKNTLNKINNGTTITGNTVSVYSDDEQDNRLPVSRPSSAPTEPTAKATRKANKKMKEEAKRLEKEQNRREKEARKMERETARRLEREAAKLEKLNRNAKKISRSTERVAATPRSGSLERRRSGEDSPVLNQSTVHGIASPNRRPTIFDVFRSSKRQKDKLLLDPLAVANTITVGGYDTSINNSTHSSVSGAGGVMNSMKVALQHSGLIGGSHHKQNPAVTITTAEGNSVVKSKYKDGSAHPHQGSDVQYYHTVTAVRRSDFSRSPMTKVMDLFRNRSNSAASEADKRKARAAAHQHQLAVQSK